VKKYGHLFVDFVFIAVSFWVATMLFQSDVLRSFLNENTNAIGSFFAGIFFTSAFTIAPAAAILGVLATKISPWTVAIYGAIGAVFGDLLIFTFVRDRFADDLVHLMGPNKKRFVHLIHMRLFRWLTPFVGALIIASPLPDELGLFLLGISKTKTKLLIPISYVMNFIGIVAVAAVAGALK
jgi:hypothetical protein